jgi:flagellar basal-body rod modification protein FlgD
MSTTVSSSTSLITAAETAAKKASTTNAASSASNAASSTSSDALSSLTSNYNQFLTLLTAQLQNQDPTSPMQSDSFTSELAQFAGVEQQIQTNTNLTQLLSLNQDSQVSQSTSLVGRQAVASSSQVALQNGSAELQISPTTAETVGIAITNSAGSVVKTQTLDLSAGTTNWAWNGQDDAGNTLSDGSYSAAVVTQDSSGNSSSVPFSVVGTITGVSKNSSNGVNIDMGTTTIDMSKVTSLLNSATSSSSASTTTTS